MSRECHGCVMLQTATDVGFLSLSQPLMPWLCRIINCLLSWCLCELKPRQLFQVLLCNVGQVVNSNTHCVHREREWDWAGHTGLCNTAQPCCNSLSCACSDRCSVTAPSNSHGCPWTPENQISGRTTFSAGRGEKQCHPHFDLSSSLISKMN